MNTVARLVSAIDRRHRSLRYRQLSEELHAAEAEAEVLAQYIAHLQQERAKLTQEITHDCA